MDGYENHFHLRIQIANSKRDWSLSNGATMKIKAGVIRTVREEIRQLEALIKSEIGS